MTIKEEIVETVKIVADKYFKKLKTDTTFKSVICGENLGKYKIVYNNSEHTAYNGLSIEKLPIGTKVFVTIPSGEIKDMFISGLIK